MGGGNCKNCRHFFNGASNGDSGLCRKSPPNSTIVMSVGIDQNPRPVNISHWPEVRAIDSCGEFNVSTKIQA